MANHPNQFTQAPQSISLKKINISGTIPDWLHGKLVRNGPALFDLESTKLQHWFDGYGMLHGFFFQNGEVFYQSKYIESDEYLNASTSGRVSTVAWGTASDPCRSVFRRFMANFRAAPSNTNVNVIKVGEKYFTTSDIATINEFDVDSLDTLSNFTASRGAVMAAHPSYTNDNRCWNMTSKFGPVVKNTFVEVTDDPSTIEHLSFQTKKVYYFHSFGNTDRYLISIEQPMQLNFAQLVRSGVQNKSFYECFKWDNQATNIFHIYDRQTKTKRSIQSDLKFFFFHTINAYEEGNTIVLDLCGYKNKDVIDDFYIDALSTTGIKDSNKASLRRITIDLEAQSVNQTDHQINLELPSINDQHRNKPYRYAYGVHSPQGSSILADKIIKFDHQSNTSQLWGRADLIVGEPIFIQSPAAKTEDDGVLLVLGHDTKHAKAELLLLDAQNLKLIASGIAPQSIPPALHGWFYNLKNTA